MTNLQKLFSLCDYEPSTRTQTDEMEKFFKTLNITPPKIVVVSTAHENNWIYDLWTKCKGEAGG